MKVKMLVIIAIVMVVVTLLAKAGVEIAKVKFSQLAAQPQQQANPSAASVQPSQPPAQNGGQSNEAVTPKIQFSGNAQMSILDRLIIPVRELLIQQEDMDPVIDEMANKFRRVQITSIAGNMGAGRVYDDESPFRARFEDVAGKVDQNAAAIEGVIGRVGCLEKQVQGVRDEVGDVRQLLLDRLPEPSAPAPSE